MSTEIGRAVLYRLDASESRFTVQAFAEGLFSAFGHDPVIEVREFTGEVKCGSESLADASISITIKAESLTVNEELKESDRADMSHKMHDDVLETAKYPEITFQSTSVTTTRAGGQFRAKIIGDLNLHGTTQKNLWVFADVESSEERLRGKGEVSLKQTDFGIKLVSVMGGTLKVKNEVKITFEIVAKRI